MRKINNKFIKLRKYYNLINYNYIFSKNSINRLNSIKSRKEDDIEALIRLKNEIKKIKNCNLKKNASNIVFSDGNPKSKIMLVGEAPGANEDKEGLPFVGRAGILLNKMLASIDLDRDKVYISNIVNYRPPENRKPNDEEIERYLPFITKHIEIINPKILVLLGSTAMSALIGNN